MPNKNVTSADIKQKIEELFTLLAELDAVSQRLIQTKQVVHDHDEKNCFMKCKING